MRYFVHIPGFYLSLTLLCGPYIILIYVLSLSWIGGKAALTNEACILLEASVPTLEENDLELLVGSASMGIYGC